MSEPTTEALLNHLNGLDDQFPYESIRRMNAALRRLVEERGKVDERGSMLEDVVNALDLSPDIIEKHGPLGTPPAELVRLVLDEKDKIIRNLRAGMVDVAALVAKRAGQEWLCEKCRRVYPGPPQPGFACVVCPECGGNTGPKLDMELRAERAKVTRLREVASDVSNQWQTFRVSTNTHGTHGIHRMGTLIAMLDAALAETDCQPEPKKPSVSDPDAVTALKYFRLFRRDHEFRRSLLRVRGECMLPAPVADAVCELFRSIGVNVEEEKS